MAREYKTRISQAIEAFAAERQDRGFCAADVSVYLDENGIDANTTTVYRNLDRMVTQDKLIKYQSADGGSSMYRMERLIIVVTNTFICSVLSAEELYILTAIP